MSYVLERFTDRPPYTLNKALNSGKRPLMRAVKEWRTWAAGEAAYLGWAPITVPVSVDVVHLRPNRASIPDTGALCIVAKAIVDGLVDAHVLPGDGPNHVRSITHRPPEVNGLHGVRLVLRELEQHLPTQLAALDRPALTDRRRMETS